jgi:hypothetical protein
LSKVGDKHRASRGSPQSAPSSSSATEAAYGVSAWARQPLFSQKLHKGSNGANQTGWRSRPEDIDQVSDNLSIIGAIHAAAR